MTLTKDDLTRPRREEVPLEFLGLSGSVWIRSLTADARLEFFKAHAKDNQLDDGARGALLADVVERQVGENAFARVFDSPEEAAAMRPDVQDVLFEVASRLSVLREQDRQALKKGSSVVLSDASPSTSPSSSDARR